MEWPLDASKNHFENESVSLIRFRVMFFCFCFLVFVFINGLLDIKNEVLELISID